MVDTSCAVPHPERVLSFGHRLSAVLLTLALALGQAGVCAGWMATPEARMACCADDGSCPMHKSRARDDGSTRVSQAEADRCCAASEPDPPPAPAGPAFSATLAPPVSPVGVMIPEPESRRDTASRSAPGPAAHVPRYLLLSVFLV